MAKKLPDMFQKLLGYFNDIGDEYQFSDPDGSYPKLSLFFKSGLHIEGFYKTGTLSEDRLSIYIVWAKEREGLLGDYLISDIVGVEY